MHQASVNQAWRPCPLHASLLWHSFAELTLSRSDHFLACHLHKASSSEKTGEIGTTYANTMCPLITPVEHLSPLA